MLFKAKSETEKTLTELRDIARAITPHISIVASRRMEIERDVGKNANMNNVELEREADEEDGPVRAARAAILSFQTQAEATAQPLFEKIERWEAELAELHQKNRELIRLRIFKATAEHLGEMLANKCSYIAPEFLAELEFQGRHVVSNWAKTARLSFQREWHDGRNPADTFAVQFPRIESHVEIVRDHSSELRKRLGVNDAS